jgi:hypothetical protein
MPAALTPRVRALILCDGVSRSRIEADVFLLRGVRCHVTADVFPFRRRLQLFLILSSPRPGRFSGYVKVIDGRTESAIFYGEILPPPIFPVGGEFLPLAVPVNVRFPDAGLYTFQVWFFRETGSDVLKMEQPFFVLD